MNPNPFASLMHSRKFWLAISDAAASIVLLWAARLLAPDVVDLVKQTIAILQPVVIAVIAGIAIEDSAKAKADATVTVAQLQEDSIQASSKAYLADSQERKK